MKPTELQTPRDTAALACRAGIATEYTDWRGERHQILEDNVAARLEPLGGAEVWESCRRINEERKR